MDRGLGGHCWGLNLNFESWAGVLRKFDLGLKV
jgi:hypothetical protein